MFASAIDTNLVAAFTKVLGANIATKIDDYTIDPADQGKVIEFTVAAKTLTLLAAATAGANFPLLIVNNSSGLLTVDADGAETINGSATALLRAGDSLLISCDGSKWIGALTSENTAALGAYKASDTSRSTTTRTADPDLQISGIEANVAYAFDAVIFVQSDDINGNIQWEWQIGTGGVLTGNIITSVSIDNPGFNAEQSDIYTWANTPIVGLGSLNLTSIRLTGTFHFTGTPSAAMTFNWALFTAGAGDTTVKAGSYIRMKKL